MVSRENANDGHVIHPAWKQLTIVSSCFHRYGTDGYTVFSCFNALESLGISQVFIIIFGRHQALWVEQYEKT